MTEKKCPNCGEEFPVDYNYCTNCMREEPLPKPREEKESHPEFYDEVREKAEAELDRNVTSGGDLY